MAAIAKNRNFFKWSKLLYFKPESANLGTFWLKIEQFWPFEEISVFCNSGHLGYRTALMDTILKGDHLRIISESLVEIASVVSEKIFF
jgi:hypothetical protein